MNPKFQFLSLSLITGSIIFGCTSGENIQSKMGRYTPRTGFKNSVPEITITKFNFNVPKRGPASVANHHNEDSSLSNKKLYFLTLIDEYETLKNYSKSFDAPKISICPNFHTGLLNHYEKYNYGEKKKITTFAKYETNLLHNENYMAHHPELFLSLSSEATTPKVIDVITAQENITSTQINDYVAKAIDIHLGKTYFELKELCENGSSDNYYIYENLITHTKSSPFQANEENMKILLKTTLFSNLAIINSLQKTNETSGRSIASSNETGSVYSKELASKLNASWSLDYIKSLRN